MSKGGNYMAKKNSKDEIKFLDPIKVNVAEQNLSDYKDYALEVVSNRAIIHLYGFKPVHLKMIYCAAFTTKTLQKTKKCARLVGDMLGIYHPHGDSSTYEAILNMLNWYDCYIPIFYGQGNFGNYQGDGPASYRYTEAKLTKFAIDCIVGELFETKQVVDWQPNYDRSTMEPMYLPIKVPILLINGSSGIGVGMKTDIPSHNINEVIDATLKLIDDPNAQIVLKPDHCMPCEIVNTNWKSICNKGHGTYIVRCHVEEGTYGGYPALFVTSLPNKTRLDPITEQIENLKFTLLPQIISIHEDCKPTKVNLIIKFKKGTDLNYVKQVLYKKTNLQTTELINFEVYDTMNNKTVRLSYKGYLQFFIEFRKITKFRLYTSRYQEIITDIHSKEMYVQLAEKKGLDKILKEVRSNKTRSKPEMIEYLYTTHDLTDVQAAFIVNNNINNISLYEVARLKEELVHMKEQADYYYNRIVDENLIIEDIKQELIAIKNEYGCKRRCKIISESEVTGVPEGLFNVIITENNFICKYGSERNTPPKFKNDKPKYICKANNTDNLIIFDNMGKVYKLPVNTITIHDNKSNGVDIRVFLKDLLGDIILIIPEENIRELSKRIDKKYVFVSVTRNGLIKKLELDEFLAVPARGFIYSKLDEGDYVQDTTIIPDNNDIIVYSKSKALRFNMEEVPLYKRNTKGNKAMNSETVDGISIIRSKTNDIVIITDHGYVNKFKVSGLPRKKRAQVGDSVIKLKRGDFIKVIYGVSKKDILHIHSTNGDIEVPVVDIEDGSSISPGIKKIATRDIVLSCKVLRKVSL